MVVSGCMILLTTHSKCLGWYRDAICIVGNMLEHLTMTTEANKEIFTAKSILEDVLVESCNACMMVITTLSLSTWLNLRGGSGTQAPLSNSIQSRFSYLDFSFYQLKRRNLYFSILNNKKIYEYIQILFLIYF